MQQTFFHYSLILILRHKSEDALKKYSDLNRVNYVLKIANYN